MAFLDNIKNFFTGSTGVVKNPLYDPNNQASNRFVDQTDRSQLTVGLHPVDQKIENAAGSTRLSQLLQTNANNFLGNNISPKFGQGLSIGADGNIVKTAVSAPGQTGGNVAPTAPATPGVTATGRNTAITAPATPGAVPSYDPSVTGAPIDTTRLSGSELKDLATRAGQAGLSLSDYTELVNANAGLSSAESKKIRDGLGIDAQSEKVFNAPKVSLEENYQKLYKEVGLGDIKKEIAKIDESLNKKRADFTKVEGEIRGNPWLSSTSRRGRLANAANLALSDIENDLTARQQYLDLYDQGVGEVETRLGNIIGDQNLTRELDTNKLNFLLNEAERKAGLQVTDRVTAGLRNVPAFLEGRRNEQLRTEAAKASIGSGAVEVPVLRMDENGAIVQGSEPPKAPTQGERTSFTFFQRMANAVQNLNTTEDEANNLGIIGQLNLNAGNSLTQGKTLESIAQAQREFTEARLRKDSGAAIPPEEYANDRKTYFPQPGDTQETLAQKAHSREVALNAMRVASGNAYWELYGVSPVTETQARLQGTAGGGSNVATAADDAYAASINIPR